MVKPWIGRIFVVNAYYLDVRESLIASYGDIVK
jgi:hypothetical protein